MKFQDDLHKINSIHINVQSMIAEARQIIKPYSDNTKKHRRDNHFLQQHKIYSGNMKQEFHDLQNIYLKKSVQCKAKNQQKNKNQIIYKRKVTTELRKQHQFIFPRLPSLKISQRVLTSFENQLIESPSKSKQKQTQQTKLKQIKRYSFKSQKSPKESLVFSCHSYNPVQLFKRLNKKRSLKSKLKSRRQLYTEGQVDDYSNEPFESNVTISPW